MEQITNPHYHRQEEDETHALWKPLQVAELGEPGGHGLTQEGGPARASILGS